MLSCYNCLKCGYEWTSNPGPTQCPKCKNLYVKWINYEEMQKIWDDCEISKNKV